MTGRGEVVEGLTAPRTRGGRRCIGLLWLHLWLLGLRLTCLRAARTKSEAKRS